MAVSVLSKAGMMWWDPQVSLRDPISCKSQGDRATRTVTNFFGGSRKKWTVEEQLGKYISWEKFSFLWKDIPPQGLERLPNSANEVDVVIKIKNLLTFELNLLALQRDWVKLKFTPPV